MSRITVYQKLFCYNTIAFKKIEKKNLHAKNTHLLYKIMQIHTKSKILPFFFLITKKNQILRYHLLLSQVS